MLYLNRIGENRRQKVVIDSHCHIYPDKIAEKASGATGKFYDVPIRFDGRISTLLENSKGIDISIVQSVATTPAQVKSINSFISAAVEEHKGRLIGLGTLHPDCEDMAGEVENILKLKLKGVKLHPDIQRFQLDDPKCLKIYEECEKAQLPLLIHTGDKRYDYSNPNRLIPIIENFKNLTIIGAHFGGWSIWEEATNRLFGYKNFYVDCSSSSFWLTPEVFKKLIYTYGPDRVLFGTDYPMWHPEEELEYFNSLHLPKEDSEKILWQNATRLFNL
ncbi:MAG: amidohydrolase family protein [Clostridiales bacterium]|nr:amidohydrolase family protein [Clostridiales bacterium]